MEKKGKKNKLGLSIQPSPSLNTVEENSVIDTSLKEPLQQLKIGELSLENLDADQKTRLEDFLRDKNKITGELKADDFDRMQELGAGNGGVVDKVMFVLFNCFLKLDPENPCKPLNLESPTVKILRTLKSVFLCQTLKKPIL